MKIDPTVIADALRADLLARGTHTLGERADGTGRFAVRSGGGSIEAGDDVDFEQFQSLHAALASFQRRLPGVIEGAVREVAKVAEGIADGRLEAVGDLIVITAQVVVPGDEDEPPRALCGFDIACDPATGRLSTMEREETWSELAGEDGN